jgi:hypothetical protein
MSLLADEEDPNKPKGSAAGAYIGGGEGGPSTKAETAPTKSGSYTNLMNYVNANQGADTGMGQAAYDVVGNQGALANTAMGNLSTTAQNEVNAGTPQVDQAALSKMSQGVGFNPQVISDINAGKYSAAPSFDFNPTMPDTTYKGPGSYNDVTGAVDTAGAVQQTQGLAGLAGSEAGVGTLLKKAYNSPSYTQGENQLDTFLTQGGQGGQGKLAQIGQDWGGIGNTLQNTYSGITGMIDQGKQKAGEAGTSWNTAARQGQIMTGAANNAYNAAWDKKQKDDAAAAQKRIDEENAKKNTAPQSNRYGPNVFSSTPPPQMGGTVPGSATIPNPGASGANTGGINTNFGGNSVNQIQPGSANLSFANKGGKIPYHNIMAMLRGQ